MQSYLYLDSADRNAVRSLLSRLRSLPDCANLQELQLIDCLTLDTAYSADVLVRLLAPLGKKITLDLSLQEDARCLPLEESPASDAAMLLHAAGIDAVATRQPLVILHGISDSQYRTIRDYLTTRTSGSSPALRTLPDDALIGFTRTPVDELTAFMHRFGLLLPEGCIAVIANHYTALGRDPRPEELLLLDEAFRQATDDPAVCAPIEFVTDDPRLHAAYADLMAKRRALSPEANAPATLAELSMIASRYLCGHSGRAIPTPRLADSTFAPAACGGFADLAGGTAVRLVASPMTDAPLRPEDRLLLITPPADHADDRLSAFLADPSVNGLVHRSLSIAEGRLISGLGRMLGNSGFGLRLTPPPTDMPLMAHLTPAAPAVLIACAAEGGKAIPAALKANGLPFRLIAVIDRQPNITLDKAPECLSFPAAMLAPRPAICGEISAPPPTEPTAADPINTLLTSLGSPDLFRTLGFDPLSAATLAQSPASITRCGDTRLCAATVSPNNDPFSAVRDTALTLIARLISDGAPLDRITLALSAEMPLHDRHSVGHTIAALLGLHTVQVELNILAAPANLHCGDVLRITVAAYAPTLNSAHMLHADLSLWLLAPRSAEPHLNGEYALLQVAAAAYAAGHTLISTGALPPSAAAAYAATMAGLSLTLTAPDEVLNTPLPCGMLIAAPEMPQLSEGVAAIALGYTRAWSADAIRFGECTIPLAQLLAAMRHDLPAPIPPISTSAAAPRISARRISQPRVLIPYTDAKPDALASVIATLGGIPMFAPIDLSSASTAHRTLSTCAELMDTAQILLLSGSSAAAAAFLSQRRITDAIAALRARDGLVCAWDGAFAALLSLGAFTDGTPIPAIPLRGQRILAAALTANVSPWTAGLPLGMHETTLLPTDPLCPVLPIDLRRAMAADGRIVSCAAGTPDGTPAITALASSDSTLLGLSAPPSHALLARAIAYFT